MLSADNAHGVHPNYPEKACPTNRPYLNEGIVIKYSANQKYTTDGMAAAVFTQICERAGVPVQKFLDRSDILGGSTFYLIAAAKEFFRASVVEVRSGEYWGRQFKRGYRHLAYAKYIRLRDSPGIFAMASRSLWFI